jgi:macrolide transport system ATP-binding/permease protein
MNDPRFVIPQLCKNRCFVALAALALALGIGINAVIFSLMNAVLLARLPVSHLELALFGNGAAAGPTDSFSGECCPLFFYPMYGDFREAAPVLDELAGMNAL